MRAPRLPIGKELAVVIGGLLLLLFATPVADWWADAGLGWTLPYGLWLLVILGALLIHLRDDADEP